MAPASCSREETWVRAPLVEVEVSVDWGGETHELKMSFGEEVRDARWEHTCPPHPWESDEAGS